MRLKEYRPLQRLDLVCYKKEGSLVVRAKLIVPLREGESLKMPDKPVTCESNFHNQYFFVQGDASGDDYYDFKGEYFIRIIGVKLDIDEHTDNEECIEKVKMLLRKDTFTVRTSVYKKPPEHIPIDHINSGFLFMPLSDPGGGMGEEENTSGDGAVTNTTGSNGEDEDIEPRG